jgi:hypothetical protein
MPAPHPAVSSATAAAHPADRIVLVLPMLTTPLPVSDNGADVAVPERRARGDGDGPHG